MKKLICLMAALMLMFTACGNNAGNDTAENGIVEDGDGIIDDNMTDDAQTGAGDAMDDAADGVDDIVDGAADATKDAVGGVENAVDEVTGNGNNN